MLVLAYRFIPFPTNHYQHADTEGALKAATFVAPGATGSFSSLLGWCLLNRKLVESQS
jgi:hypothetical protein